MPQTTTCPSWCTWVDNPNHIEGDSDGSGAVLRTHARAVAEGRIAGHRIGVDLIQEEVTRGGVVELSPPAVFLGDIPPAMTAAEARMLSTMLLAGAEAVEALR